VSRVLIFRAVSLCRVEVHHRQKSCDGGGSDYSNRKLPYSMSRQPKQQHNQFRSHAPSSEEKDTSNNGEELDNEPYEVASSSSSDSGSTNGTGLPPSIKAQLRVDILAAGGLENCYLGKLLKAKRYLLWK
jgi:hypothetical protein